MRVNDVADRIKWRLWRTKVGVRLQIVGKRRYIKGSVRETSGNRETTSERRSTVTTGGDCRQIAGVHVASRIKLEKRSARIPLPLAPKRVGLTSSKRHTRAGGSIEPELP